MKKILLFGIFFSLCLYASAQERTISGQVTSEDGSPLPGVNVLLKGTLTGTVTNVEGNYTLSVPSDGTLVFSFIGYTATEIPISGQTTINAVLSADITQLEEIVVTGTAAGQSAKTLSFSVGQVSEEMMTTVPPANLGTGLQGKVAGLRVVSGGGQPGRGVNFQARAANSLATGQHPLIILDGVFLANTTLADINPEDIERIEVLKGSAGASLYGSQAANGVIQIFTKRGSSVNEGETRVVLRSEWGISQLANDRFPTSRSHAFQLDETGNLLVGPNGGLVEDPDGLVDNPWPNFQDYQSDIFRDGLFSQNSISVQGRSRTTNFFASAQRLDDTGVYAFNDGYSRNAFRVNIDHRLSDQLDLSVSSSYSTSTQDFVQENGTNSIMNSILFMPPIYDLQNSFNEEDSSRYDWDIDTLASTTRNPYYQLVNRESEVNRTRLIGHFRVNYDVTNWLTLDGSAALDRSSNNFVDFIPKGYLSDDTERGQAVQRSATNTGGHIDKSQRINNDGLPDIYFGGNQVPDRLYQNLGNLHFKDISKGIQPNRNHTWSTGITMVDINRDGWLDIYVCKNVNNNTDLSTNLLFINNGDLTFTEKAAAYGLDDKGYSVEATFFDYDKDGLIDVYLVNQPPSLGNRRGNKINLDHVSLLYSDKLYKNMGKGEFTDVSDYADTRNLAYGLSATTGDFNGDGWPDLYVANDFDLPDHLYINQQNGKFKNRINQAAKHISNFSMGTDLADYDNDGLLDIMVLDMVAEDHKRIKTNMGGMEPKDFWKIVNKGWHYQYMFNTLQRNNGNGTFSEVAHMAGVSNTDWSWGPLLADFNNDGWKDLFVTNGIKRNMRYSDLDKTYSKRLDSLELEAKRKGVKLNDLIDVIEFVEMAPTDKLPNYIYENMGDLTFQKRVESWGMEKESLSNGAAYADLDLDGDLDLVVNNIDEEAYLYRNNSMEQGGANFLRLQVTSPEMVVYGTKVELYLDEKIWQFQELTNTRGYMSKSEDVVHFGLAHQALVEKVVVIWPDEKKLILENVPANQVVTVSSEDASSSSEIKDAGSLLFTKAVGLGLEYLHRENSFNDFEREVLLPHKMSNFGPGLAVGDVNGDGLEDFYIGGALGFSGALFIQRSDGRFEKDETAFQDDLKAFEDLGAVFLDVDNDGDLDLYVVSGGNEPEEGDDRLQDRLYMNSGKGGFRWQPERLPDLRTSGSCVVPQDFDQDGDLDLFVGGRVVPGKYPRPAKSYLLRNDAGTFKDVTAEIAPDLARPGLVTAAVWTDFNHDGTADLVVTGEWMPVKMLANQSGRFTDVTKKAGLANATGWYFSLATADFDRDGDQDLIAGNLGLNYKYKASEEEPFEVYSDDLDDDGSLDIVLSYYEHGEPFPVRGRSCSSRQIPALKEKFPTFESFGEANLFDVYGDGLQQAFNYKAKNFATLYFENKGNGQFEQYPLPNEAQLSSVNSILARDFNDDGHVDLLIAGNLYASETETPRNDAGMGLYLEGDGKGNFKPVPLLQSGFFAPHDVKDMKMIKVGKGNDQREVILVANNCYWLQAIEHHPRSGQTKEGE